MKSPCRLLVVLTTMVLVTQGTGQTTGDLRTNRPKVFKKGSKHRIRGSKTRLYRGQRRTNDSGGKATMDATNNNNDANGKVGGRIRPQGGESTGNRGASGSGRDGDTSATSNGKGPRPSSASGSGRGDETGVTSNGKGPRPSSSSDSDRDRNGSYDGDGMMERPVPRPGGGGSDGKAGGMNPRPPVITTHGGGGGNRGESGEDPPRPSGGSAGGKGPRPSTGNGGGQEDGDIPRPPRPDGAGRDEDDNEPMGRPPRPSGGGGGGGGRDEDDNEPMGRPPRPSGGGGGGGRDEDEDHNEPMGRPPRPSGGGGGRDEDEDGNEPMGRPPRPSGGGNPDGDEDEQPDGSGGGDNETDEDDPETEEGEDDEEGDNNESGGGESLGPGGCDGDDESPENYPFDVEPPVLDARLLNLTKVAIELSSATFFDEPMVPETPSGVRDLRVYRDEPDAAIFARYREYCFVAFRGLTNTLADLLQIASTTLFPVCREDRGHSSCFFRGGWVDAFFTDYLNDLARDVRSCAAECSDPLECVVFTGASAGGSIAPVASVFFADLHPITITFAEPATVLPDCLEIDRSRTYRFVNTQVGGDGELRYDYIAFSPRYMGTSSLGHLLVLSEDDTSVAYLGTDVDEIFIPQCLDCHRIRIEIEQGAPSYQRRIGRLYQRAADNGFQTVPVNGFRNGFPCTRSAECQSTFCVLGVCRAERLGRCQDCDQNSDCQSGDCTTTAFGCGFNLLNRRCR